jgi:hypothetical protein
MISIRKKAFLNGTVFASLPAIAMLIFSVFFTYNWLVARIGDDINLVQSMVNKHNGKEIGASGSAEKHEIPEEIRQIAGFIPIQQGDPLLPNSLFRAEKRSAGRLFSGFSPQSFLSLGLCTVISVLMSFSLRQRHTRDCRVGNAGRVPHSSSGNTAEIISSDAFSMSAEDGVLAEENRTLASVNSKGSTFAVFWRRCRDMRSEGPKRSGKDPCAEYTDPLVLFFKNNSSASLDMVRIISRLEKESEFLNTLRTYAFRTSLLLRDLGFQLPSKEGAGQASLVETILDYYAITVHGIKKESDVIAAFETAKKAEELETAARKGDLVFLQENTPAFLEYMEFFITGVVKLTEEKNVFNDRRLHAKHKNPDLPRRFGKRHGKKSS